MAKQRFQPIPLAAMQTAMGNPGFSGLVAGDLGSDGTVADGFDAVLGSLIWQVGAELQAGPYLDSIILAADFSGDSVYSPQWSDAVSSFASLSAAGNSILAQTLGILATAPGKPPAMPAPTPAPAPIVPAPVKAPPVYTGGGGVVFNPGVPTGPIVPPDYCTNYANDTDICPSEQ